MGWAVPENWSCKILKMLTRFESFGERTFRFLPSLSFCFYLDQNFFPPFRNLFANRNGPGHQPPGLGKLPIYIGVNNGLEIGSMSGPTTRSYPYNNYNIYHHRCYYYYYYFTVCLGIFHLQMVISNLTTNMFYGIQLQAATKSLYHKDVLYKGQLTSVQKLQLRKNCDQIQAFTVLESENHQSAINLANPILDMGTGVLAGLALIAMVFILVIVAFVLRR